MKSRMQFSPALCILGFLASISLVCYVYRYTILDAIETGAKVLGGLVVCWIAIVVLVKVLCWFRQGRVRSRAATATSELEATADALADDTLQMRWTPDGKDLEVVKENP